MAVEPGQLEHARAVRAGSARAAASGSICASVSVPVLSVHSTSMLPRSWIAPRRLTITALFAIRSAPRASVTETIIGSSSGVSPTASATANRKHSSSGRWNSTLTSSTNSTRSTVSRTISSPKRWVPCSSAVGGGAARSAAADLAELGRRAGRADEQPWPSR